MPTPTVTASLMKATFAEVLVSLLVPSPIRASSTSPIFSFVDGVISTCIVRRGVWRELHQAACRSCAERLSSTPPKQRHNKCTERNKGTQPIDEHPPHHFGMLCSHPHFQLSDLVTQPGFRLSELLGQTCFSLSELLGPPCVGLCELLGQTCFSLCELLGPACVGLCELLGRPRLRLAESFDQSGFQVRDGGAQLRLEPFPVQVVKLVKLLLIGCVHGVEPIHELTGNLVTEVFVEFLRKSCGDRHERS